MKPQTFSKALFTVFTTTPIDLHERLQDRWGSVRRIGPRSVALVDGMHGFKIYDLDEKMTPSAAMTEAFRRYAAL